MADLKAELLRLNFKECHIDSAIRSRCRTRKEAIAHITGLIQSLIRSPSDAGAQKDHFQPNPPFLKVNSLLESFKSSEFLRKPEPTEKPGPVPVERLFDAGEKDFFQAPFSAETDIAGERFRNRMALKMDKIFERESFSAEAMAKRYLAEENANRERIERNKNILRKYEINFCDFVKKSQNYSENGLRLFDALSRLCEMTLLDAANKKRFLVKSLNGDVFWDTSLISLSILRVKAVNRASFLEIWQNLMSSGEIEPYAVDIATDSVYDIRNICINHKPKGQSFSNAVVRRDVFANGQCLTNGQ